MNAGASDAWDSALPRVLAKLYPTVDEARIVVEDVHLDASTIDFKDAAVENWHEILGAALAQDHDCIARIVQRAARDFPGDFDTEMATERELLAESPAPPDPAAKSGVETPKAPPAISRDLGTDGRPTPISGAQVVDSLATEIGGSGGPSFMGRLADYILRIPPLNALGLLVLSGASLLLLTHAALGGTVFSPDGNVTRSVGFVWAVNWSLNLALVFPFAALFVLLTLQAVPALFRELAVRRMLVTLDLRPVHVAVAVEAWNRAFRSRMKIVAPVAGIGLVVSVLEWWLQSGRPLWLNDPTWTAAAIRAGDVEADWTIDALLDGAGHIALGDAFQRLANAGLSLLAFLNQAVWVAAFVVLLYTMWAVGRTMQALSDDRGDFRLVPNLESNDARRGFEIFEPMIDLALWSVAGFYAMFYLSRVWNAYLRSSAETLSQFLADVRVLSFTDDFSTMSVTLGALLSFISSIVFVAWILRDGAKQGNHYLQRRLQEAPESVSQLTGMDAEMCQERMRLMTFWPTNSLRPNALLIVILCGTIGIITAYQFVPLAVFGLVAAKGTRRVQRLRRLGEGKGRSAVQLYLSEATLNDVYEAAIALRLVDSREALLAGVDRRVVAILPVERRPRNQLRSDLKVLNSVHDEASALRRWLKGALSLAPRSSDELHPESVAFRKALTELDRGTV